MTLIPLITNNIPKPLHIKVTMSDEWIQRTKIRMQKQRKYYSSKWKHILWYRIWRNNKDKNVGHDIYIIFKKETGWKVADGDAEKGIKCHYKIVDKSLAQLRAEMELNDNEIENILDYFLFLECGY